MAAYIATSDITSTVLSDFNLSGYVNIANLHIEGYANSLGVGSGNISTPVNYLVKEYLVNYASRLAVQDKIGANNIEIGQDKYVMLYDIFNKEVERLRPYITGELLLNTVDSLDDGARTSILMRC